MFDLYKHELYNLVQANSFIIDFALLENERVSKNKDSK